jgi:hypothetical protein
VQLAMARQVLIRLWIAVVMVGLNLQQQVEGWKVLDRDADDRFYVRIRNELPRTLAVHCKSGDNDLGVQYVPPGREYMFKFHENVWGTTMYWCRFVDGQRWNSFQVWEAPGAPFKKMPCWKCLWVARVGGFWRAEDGHALTIVQPWRQDRNWPPAANQIPN